MTFSSVLRGSLIKLRKKKVIYPLWSCILKTIYTHGNMKVLHTEKGTGYKRHISPENYFKTFKTKNFPSQHAAERK